MVPTGALTTQKMVPTGALTTHTYKQCQFRLHKGMLEVLYNINLHRVFLFIFLFCFLSLSCYILSGCGVCIYLHLYLLSFFLVLITRPLAVHQTIQYIKENSIFLSAPPPSPGLHCFTPPPSPRFPPSPGFHFL